MKGRRVSGRPWKKTDLAYFAGLIDGEGTIGFAGVGHDAYLCRFAMGNTNLRLLHWVQQRFGGTVIRERRITPGSHRWKPIFRWVATAEDIEEILVAVLPYLVGKREQAELMLIYRDTLAPPISGHRSAEVLSADVKLERHRIVSAMTSLNKRGA